MKGDERFQSKEYLDFIRAQPCIVPGCTDASDPHHTTSQKWLDGSDLGALPISRAHHNEGHYEIGWVAFQEKYKLDFDRLKRKFIEKFLAERGFATKYKESKRKNRKPLVKKFRKAKPLSKACNSFHDTL